MSWYSKEDFEYVIAKRTKANLEFLEQRYHEEIDAGISEADVDVFEVTQLLNSFMGLLVIPRQAFFDYLPDNAEFQRGSEADDILNGLRQDKSRYRSTYRRCEKKGREKVYYADYEALTPKTLVMRLRNAMSHNNLEIMPIKCKEDNKIEGFKFQDYCILHGEFIDGCFVENSEKTIKQNFRITLSVREMRVLLYGLNELLLSQYE